VIEMARMRRLLVPAILAALLALVVQTYSTSGASREQGRLATAAAVTVEQPAAVSEAWIPVRSPVSFEEEAQQPIWHQEMGIGR
jgi:hypothetical protein